MGDREELHPSLPELPNLRVVKSYGDSLERAILTGYSHAKGDKVLVIDADGSHPFDAVPRMFAELENYDMVVGSRYLKGSEYDYSAFRKFVAWCFRLYAHIFGSKLRDPMSGFFAVRREVIDKVAYKPLTWKTCLELEMKAKPKVLEIPIKFDKRQQGASKANIKTGLKLLWEIITL